MSSFSAADFGLPEHVSCPFCEGNDTSLHSPFGPQLSVASYWCRRCSTAFEWMKWEPDRSGPDATASPDDNRPARLRALE
jgi:hypothetical protein